MDILPTGHPCSSMFAPTHGLLFHFCLIHPSTLVEEGHFEWNNRFYPLVWFVCSSWHGGPTLPLGKKLLGKNPGSRQWVQFKKQKWPPSREPKGALNRPGLSFWPCLARGARLESWEVYEALRLGGVSRRLGGLVFVSCLTGVVSQRNSPLEYLVQEEAGKT